MAVLRILFVQFKIPYSQHFCLAGIKQMNWFEKSCVMKVRLLKPDFIDMGEDKARFIHSLIPLQSGKTKTTTQVFCHVKYLCLCLYFVCVCTCVLISIKI